MGLVEYDAVVVGAGPGGYPCAIRLGQLGKDLVHRERKLGWCVLKCGLYPSKTLISLQNVIKS